MERAIALVVGADGVVGRNLIDRLAAIGTWDAIALSRRPSPVPARGRPVHVDLSDRDACLRLGPALRDVTHVFYCARAVSSDAAEEERINLAMLANIADAVDASAPNLTHIQIMEGSKWYGCHLGPFKTPAYEEDARHLPPNYYYAQHDLIESRQRRAGWTWSALRPHTVWGIGAGHDRSFVLLLAAFATICKHLRLPLCFPGSDVCFTAVSQATDARLLASAMTWAATTPRCANNAFNLVNGDVFRWRHLWAKLAAFFDVEAGPVQSMRLAERMTDKAPIWDEIVRVYGLQPTPFAALGDWSYFDFTLRFDFDSISAMTKARQYGFNQFVDTETSLLDLLQQLRDRRVVP